MSKCTNLIQPALADAFESGVEIHEDEGDCRLILPFERFDGDAITLWVIDEGSKFKVTDEGETYGTLYVSNVDLSQDRRSNRVRAIKERFNLDSAMNEVSLRAEEEDLGHRILDAYQAIQAISYLAYTRQSYPQTDFRDDIAQYLYENQYQFDRNRKIEAASEPQQVDFNITNVPQMVLLQGVHATSEASLHEISKNVAYKWLEIKMIHREANCIAIVDDEGGTFDDDQIKPITTHSTDVVRWSEKDKLPQVIGSPA